MRMCYLFCIICLFSYVLLSSLILVELICICCIFFFKQKTAYEMRISDWSSDVCSSDLLAAKGVVVHEADYSRSETLGPALAGVDTLLLISGNEEIGRASCRERVCQYV